MFIDTGLNRSSPAPPPPPPPASAPAPEQPNYSDAPNTGKSVQFDLSQPSKTPDLHSPNTNRRKKHRRERDGKVSGSSNSGDVTPTEATAGPSRRHRHRRHSADASDRRHQNQVPRPSSPSASSDTTVDLPPRFDKYGRKIPERGDDPLVDRLNDFLGEGAPGGKWLNKIVGVFGGDESDNDDRDKRRRRRR